MDELNQVLNWLENSSLVLSEEKNKEKILGSSGTEELEKMLRALEDL